MLRRPVVSLWMQNCICYRFQMHEEVLEFTALRSLTRYVLQPQRGTAVSVLRTLNDLCSRARNLTQCPYGHADHSGWASVVWSGLSNARLSRFPVVRGEL